MAIHRTTQAVNRDKDLVSGVEHGVRASFYDGLGLYNNIKQLAANTKGLNCAEVRSNLISKLRNPIYIPGPDGIKHLFASIKATRTDLITMNPPTWFDDATVLLDVNRVLQAAHVETFIAAKEQIENNAEGNGTLTDMKGAEAVFKRFEKRLVARITTPRPSPKWT